MPAPQVHLRQRSRKSCARAFTLVELSVVVFIIGLIAVIAVPQIKKSIMAARSEATINDLRVFTQAFQHYLQEKGDWPATQNNPGEIPAGMETYLSKTSWTRVTPIGGYYIWQNQTRQGGQKIQASIAINSSGDSVVTSDQLQLEDVDRRVDDGNLSTGSFRLGFGNEPVFIIEP